MKYGIKYSFLFQIQYLSLRQQNETLAYTVVKNIKN